jgi:hypothetical protein
MTDLEGGDPMLYEMRIYHCMPGRLPDLNKRFEAVTLIIDTALGATSNATANPLMNLILAAVSNDAIV